MRIVAGEFRGRHLSTPRGSRVRPTSERVREAWFSILQPHLPGAKVVDLFAGSGALGFEALSRGAGHADLVESSASGLTALRKNAETLGVGARVSIVRADAIKFVRKLEKEQYHIAFADPPYASDGARRLAQAFAECPFANILGVEHEAKLDLEASEVRRYGTIALSFFYLT